MVLTFLDVYIKIFIACVFKGSQEQSFPSDTLTLTTYSISRNGSKKFNICTCEHMILSQLTMGARQTKNAPLTVIGTDDRL